MSPVILEADYLGDADVFEVSATVNGTERRETFSRAKYGAMVARIAHGFEVGGFLFVYNQYSSRDIGPRARRSFIQYFRSLLERSN